MNNKTSKANCKKVKNGYLARELLHTQATKCKDSNEGSGTTMYLTGRPQNNLQVIQGRHERKNYGKRSFGYSIGLIFTLTRILLRGCKRL